MIELVLIVCLGVFLTYKVQRYQPQIQDVSVLSPKNDHRLRELWQKANQAISAERYRSAEKVLLTILRLDHKNSEAYNKLGIIYAKQENYEDARECFEIASSLTPTLACLYNLGLVQFEIGRYQQAANSFQRVVDLEPTAARYMALAKAYMRMNNLRKMVEALESAYRLSGSKRLAHVLVNAYDSIKETVKADKLRRKLKKAAPETQKQAQARISRF